MLSQETSGLASYTSAMGSILCMQLLDFVFTQVRIVGSLLSTCHPHLPMVTPVFTNEDLVTETFPTVEEMLQNTSAQRLKVATPPIGLPSDKGTNLS